MECNKEEALRAKGIAEKKMAAKDFLGAKKIMVRAQQLFPELENVSQMLTVCEVHCSAEMKCVGSEMDWYAILQVEQTADETSIKKQYRKLCLLLHPDKNKFAGAEAAFKLVGEASRVLTDQSKRSVYDMKRKAAFRQPSLPRQPQPPNRNSYAKKQTGVQTQNSFMNHGATQFAGLNRQPQQQQAQLTFWTVCPFCGIKYQYYRDILNRALRCQHCTKPFIAHDINIPGMPQGANFGFSWNQGTFPQQKDIPSQGAQGAAAPTSSGTGFQGKAQGEAIPTGIPTAMAGFKEKKTEGGVGPDDVGKEAERRRKFEAENLKEMNEKGQAENPPGHSGRKRGRKATVVSSDKNESSDSEEVIVEEGFQNASVGSNYYPRRSSRNKQHVSYNEDGSDDDFMSSAKSKKPKVDRVSGKANDPNSEMGSRGDSKKTKESPAETAASDDDKEEKQKRSVPAKESVPNGNEQERNAKESVPNGNGQERKVKNEEGCEDGVKSRADSNGESSDLSSDRPIKPEILEYPDPEFHDFDGNRAENCFEVDQIWAIYDNLQGMPRYYARVRKVYPGSFQLRITWLEPDPNRDEEINWYNEDLPIACGNFKMAKSEVTTDRLMFSHQVCWEKGARRGSLSIYPRKGDVWALYKDWDSGWSSNPDNHREYEYEIVEVLTDYKEGVGTTVVYMVKVKGFVSLFQRMVSKGPEVSFQIPDNELYRFSHMVAAYIMTGNERENVPKGSLELDPGSVPCNLEECSLSPNLKESKVEETTSSVDRGEAKPGTEKTRTPKKGIEIKENSSIKGKEDSRNGDHIPSRKYLEEKGKDLDGLLTKKPNHASPVKHRVEEKSKHLDGGKVNLDQVPKSPRSPPVHLDTVVYEYPDPEFHDFAEDRSEAKFKADQIWAVYSEDDGMPRFYGRIKRLEISDFKLHIVWLEPQPTLEKDVRWSKEKLPIVCGTFKPKSSRTELFCGTGKFSHRIQLEPSVRNSKYEIYPRKGEVWAMYQSWDAEWKFLNLRNCEYEMVEIISNISDENGLRVLLLAKVVGYRTVFKPQKKAGFGITVTIARDELTRFSHQVPAFQLSGERGGKLRGYWELDPASLPPELFCGNSHKNGGR